MPKITHSKIYIYIFDINIYAYICNAYTGISNKIYSLMIPINIHRYTHIHTHTYAQIPPFLVLVRCLSQSPPASSLASLLPHLSIPHPHAEPQAYLSIYIIVYVSKKHTASTNTYMGNYIYNPLKLPIHIEAFP